jgi:nitrate reductase NapAB chaperone NapD
VTVSARDVIKLIDDWHPRGCKTEKDLERSLHRHLEKSLPTSEIIMQYASGRVKGDIAIDGQILIEIKDGLKSTGQLQRLLGQLELYAAQWKGKVIVLVSGDSQRDLVNTLTKKIETLKGQALSMFELFEEDRYFLVLRGSGQPKEKPSTWW